MWIEETSEKDNNVDSDIMEHGSFVGIRFYWL
jgi:hypothetical protein